mgnify:CR=1 FL=1
MPLPVPNLDTKRFDELIDEARRLIPRYAPEWTNHNLPDPGITFIELFAWLAEMQIYYLNQIPEKNYLKYLNLLGVKPKPATPAKVDLTFSSDKLVTILKGTRVVTKSQEKNITFELDEDIDVLPVELKKVVIYSNYKFTVVDIEKDSMQRGTFYYAFGRNAEAGSQLYLGFNEDINSILNGVDNFKITFSLFENDLPPVGTHGDGKPEVYPSVELKWEYRGEGEWKPLRIEDDQTNNLTKSGKVTFLTKGIIMEKYSPVEGKGEFYWIRCGVIKQGYEIPPRITTIQLNTISATEGITVKAETPGKSSGLPEQIFSIKNKPILYKSQKVYVDSQAWEEVDDFDASTPNDNHYVLNRANGEVIFGNGIRGRIPTKGAEIKIDYRYGGGEEGNVPAEVNWQLSNNMEDIEGIKNLFPATGGKEEESIDEAKFRARKELKAPYRAVTSEDFQTIAKATPGIRVARAGVQILPKENKVKVAVVPYSLYERPIPSEGFKRTVCEHLDKHRLITTQIEVIEPEYVKVSVTASVKIKPQNSPELVRKRVEEALNTFLHPLKGGPDGNGWQFGREVYKSEVYEVIEKIDGVDGVVDLSLSKGGNINELTLVYPGRHRIEIALSQTVCKEESIRG